MVFHTTYFPREEDTKYIFHEDNLILLTLEEIGLGYDNESISIHSSMNVWKYIAILNVVPRLEALVFNDSIITKKDNTFDPRFSLVYGDNLEYSIWDIFYPYGKISDHVIKVEAGIHFVDFSSYTNEYIEFQLKTNIKISNDFELYYVSIERWRKKLTLKFIIQDGI